MKTSSIKAIVSTFISVILLTFSSGCSDFLREKPYDFIGLEDLDDCQESIDYLVTGVYSKWNDDLFRYNSFPYVLENDADYISGPGWLFGALGAGNFQAADQINAMWSGCYNLIERCNSASENIEPMVNVEDAAKANALAEIYFNKAYTYFILTRAFGEIPLSNISAKRTQAEGGSLHNERSEIKTVYAEIIRLLEFAEQNLYAISDPSYKTGHVAQGTAAGLLAKVYATMASGSITSGTITVKSGKPCNPSNTKELYPATPKHLTKNVVAGYEEFSATECYAKVIDYCEKLEAGEYGNYDLLDFSELWKQASFNKIDQCEYMFTIYSVSNDEVYGNLLSRYYSYTDDGTGCVSKGLWVGCRNHWYELFEDGDRRITQGVLHRWQTTGKPNGIYFPQSYQDTAVALLPPFNDGLAYSPATGAQNLAFSTKYFNVSDRTVERSDAYYPMLRYADVLLLYAEALNETGQDMQAAKDLVKRIRVRSLATATTSDLDNASSTDDVRSLIIEERAKELAYESDRRWDLIRWGIYLEAMNAIEGPDEAGLAKSRQEKHLLYPKPIDEILANDKITENNIGWN